MQKLKEEEEKAARKLEREAKQKEKEAEKQRRLLEKEKRKMEKCKQKKQKTVCRKVIVAPSQTTKEVVSFPSESHSSCGGSTDEDGLCHKCRSDSHGKWISCDMCDAWFHTACVGLEDNENLSELEWNCSSCDFDQ